MVLGPFFPPEQADARLPKVPTDARRKEQLRGVFVHACVCSLVNKYRHLGNQNYQMDFCFRKQQQALDRGTHSRHPPGAQTCPLKFGCVFLPAGLWRGTRGTFPGA